MADVTVTLSEEEANLIWYMLKLHVDYVSDRVSFAEEILSENGSLDGVFGEAVKQADQKILEGQQESVKIYTDLRNKFALLD